MLGEIREKFTERELTQKFTTDLQILERDLRDGKNVMKLKYLGGG